MRDSSTTTSTKSSPNRKPFASNCCSVDDQTVLGNLSRCRPSKSEFSKNHLGPLPSFRRLSFADLSRSSSARINEDLAEVLGADLVDFQMCELKMITQCFSRNYLLGEGGFGKVYKGYIDENLRQSIKAQPVAVKLLDIEGLQGHREWLVRTFTRISISLPWATRLKIAVAAAKGLAFLHDLESPIIYRDFKTSNILLDSDFTAKLSDFGLATMGPEGFKSHVTTRVMGTYGYAAPEYVSTASEKSRPKNQQNIIDWAKPYLTSRRRLRCDTALLALQCVSPNPKDRPKMPAVVEVLESLMHHKDMAVSSGHWPPSPSSQGGKVSQKVRGDNGNSRKSAPGSLRS
ncbi:hypothetical protein Bca4012_030701 [Brassica carinata]|uniref:Protein kinase domain-containing protein n=1 Tax=Brassica carinata TaxID=52824 RepID=A0A8X7RFR5_BRACI|nr:hypothetical protein Bca52824_048032 [Brassica carinata]